MNIKLISPRMSLRPMDSEFKRAMSNPIHYNTSHVVFSPMNMTKDQLQQGYLRIYKRFYSTRNIFKRIPKRRDQLISYLLFNFVYRKFGKLFSLFAKIGLMSSIGKLARRLSYGID